MRTPIASRGASLEKPDDAWDAFQWWYSQRAYPHELIPQGAFQKAALYAKTKMRKENPASLTATPPWVPLGPYNVGGRVLSLAVDPSSTNIVWAGSASGGLWKSTSGGEGSTAWSYASTGFPALAVSTIAIDPTNTQVMYIGTGEISGYHRPQVGTPGARSSYGMGILKSTDGGTSWVQTGLTFTFPQVTAIEKIAINPVHSQSIFAATSEGVYKSTNAGAAWFISDTTVMAMDIAIKPSDTTIIYSTHGNLNSSPNPGLFRSTDAGVSWLQLTNGLPSTNFGRAVLSISPAQPSRVYVAIANASTGAAYGLYRSDDDGGLWTLVSGTNFTNTQGWYDIAVGVKPTDPNRVFTSGLDVYRSTTGGTSTSQQSFWYLGYGGTVPPGGPEGPANYSHADHHAIVFDPVHPDTVYFGCDGGVFKSTDGGVNFYGCNGGLATTQFYNGFANAFNDSLVAIGGLQDNGVVKYQGSTTWNKVDGGDGGWNAIDATNKNIMYDEYVYLAMKKATNGLSFSGTTSGLPTGSSNANFIAPFAISTSSPSILYAGNLNVYKTTNGGGSWFASNGGGNLNGTKLACIGVSYTSPDTLLAGTGTSTFGLSPLFQVFSSTNGGGSWTNVTGTLPARYPTDIEFDPTLSSTVYVTYSGYGGPHVFRSTNVGQTWTDISGTLPDIPHQSVVVDPVQPNNVYVGTDLGVFHSSNSGASWEDFSSGMVPAMILDLAVSRPNGVLRAATFGNGVFERKLARTPIAPTTGSISGVKFNDANDNGARDGGETGLPNWTIQLTIASPPALISTTTDVNGNYTFSNLAPGTVTVAEVGQAGWAQTHPSLPPTYTIVMSSGLDTTGLDFGNFQAAGISGTVFEDVNGDTLKEVGEPGLLAWQVRLSGTKTDSMLTDVSGNYAFTNLIPGNYTVTEVLQAGRHLSRPSGGSYSISIGGGNQITGKDFGNFRYGSIAGMKFNDMNANGIKNVGEPGIADWVLHLAGPVAASALTDSNGNYSFVNLVPGSYSLSESSRVDWIQIHPPGNGSYPIALRSGLDTSGLLFGNHDGAGEVYGVLDGWNLLSLPRKVSDNHRTAVYPSSISNAFAYAGGYQHIDTLHEGVGFWLKFSGAQSVLIPGDTLANDTVDVSAGWNIIGSLTSAIPVSAIVQIPDSIVSSPYFSYGMSGYQISDSLRPHQGNWVRAASGGRLALSSGGSAAPVAPPGIKPPASPPLGTLTVSDSRGGKRTLYFRFSGGSDVEGRLYELPPPPPAGAFDVRYAAGGLLASSVDGKPHDYPILISSGDYPLSMSCDLAGLAGTAALIIDQREISLTAGQSVQIAASSKMALRLGPPGSAERPARFLLEQNYPNPFNPTTRFQYTVAAAGLVTLKMYDALGREVATIVDEVKQPGVYQAEWDARSFPSGVYTCRMQAGSFSNSKKVVFLR